MLKNKSNSSFILTKPKNKKMTGFSEFERYCKGCGEIFRTKARFGVKCDNCKEKRLKEMVVERSKTFDKICKICHNTFNNPNPCVFTCLECKRNNLLGHDYKRYCKVCGVIFDTSCKRGKVCDNCKVENKYKRYPNKKHF